MELEEDPLLARAWAAFATRTYRKSMLVPVTENERVQFVRWRGKDKLDADKMLDLPLPKSPSVKVRLLLQEDPSLPKRDSWDHPIIVAMHSVSLNPASNCRVERLIHREETEDTMCHMEETRVTDRLGNAALTVVGVDHFTKGKHSKTLSWKRSVNMDGALAGLSKIAWISYTRDMTKMHEVQEVLGLSGSSDNNRVALRVKIPETPGLPCTVETIPDFIPDAEALALWVEPLSRMKQDQEVARLEQMVIEFNLEVLRRAREKKRKREMDLQAKTNKLGPRAPKT